MKSQCVCGVVLFCLTGVGAVAAPVIDPLPAANIPAGKTLIVPVTAASSNGRPLTFTARSSIGGITVAVHTNNPFWKMTVVQAAPANAPGAYPTPFRGGAVTVTNVGDLTFMLFRELAPHTVDVIQGLTAAGLYTSNTLFHRVIAGFMIQGGDPDTNGTGGPVFRYDDEFNPDAIFSGRGQLALANSGKDTDGSQFFVTVAPYRYGDFGYTIFGQLVRGFDVLSNLNSTATDANNRPLADEIIAHASLVPDPFDTVLTLSATNHAGVAGTISVVADDGAGGRATNTFTATTVADATIEAPFLYPVTVTNLVAPANTPLTNYVFGCDFPGVTNNWYVQFADANSFQDASNSFFKVVTNQLMLVMVPDTNYAGPVRCNVYVSGSPAFSSYDVQNYTFAFGDTAIAATAGNFEAEALTPITNCLLARFTNGVPGAAPANFSASINWGDNTISSGLIVTNPAGWKEVRGTHTYTNAGNYPVYVTLQSALGASATMVSTGSVPPSLTLTRTATNDLVGWPAWATDYQLQSNTNPALADWTAVTNFPALSGYRSVVRDSPTGGTVFYRLKK